MDGTGGSAGAESLAESKTNTSKGSLVDGLVDPQPLVFYRPETHEFLVVPAQAATAFENECRLLDRLMWNFHNAKERHLTAQEDLLDARRAAEAHNRSVPQSSQKLQDAQRAADAAEKKLIDAQQDVEAEFKPLDKLDSTGGKLYELIPIRQRSTPLPERREAGGKGPQKRSETDQTHHAWGRKWTYVRSEKVKNHSRSYKLNDAEQEKYQSSQKKSVVTPAGKIDTAKLKEQLTELDTKVSWKKEVGVGGVLFTDLNASIRETLEDWANGTNAGNQHVELGVEAQLLRYFAGAGVSTTWNPKKGNVAVRGDARAEFAIAEGKFAAAAYWPSRGGHMIQLKGPKSGKMHQAGLIRLGAQLELFGLAGASACAQLALEVDYSGTRKDKAGMRGKPSSKPLSSKGLELGGQLRDGAEVGGAVDLFAGARAGGSVKGILEWNSPEGQKFEALCKIGPGGQVQAGAGVSGQFKIDYKGGKFRVLASAAVCWGVGAGGKLEFEVDPANTFEFVKYLAYMLYSVGYEFLEILTAEAFDAWKSFSLWAIQAGKTVEDAINQYGERVEMALMEIMAQLEKEAERVALMERVLANPKTLDYAPPETKGIILYQLTRHGWITKGIIQNYDGGSPDTLGRRKRAVLTVCKKARSRAEFRNICQHMTADGSKDPKGWQENYAHLQRFLDHMIDTRNMDQQLRDFETNLAALYDRLYDQPVLGYPFVDNDQRTYMARVERGDHDGYLVAGGYDPGPPLPEFRFDQSHTQTRYA